MSRLIVSDVSKKIGKNQVLSNINLELESGNTYGFVGRNGSGKTMLFRAIAGLMSVDAGYIKYGEKVLSKDCAVFDSLGLVLENAGLYPEFSGYENLLRLSKIKKKASSEQIKNAISRVGLDPNDRRKIRKYSLGMKQRIVLAQAIMEKPEILLLDEPTNALDESGVELIRNIVNEEKERGALILIASHNQDDINMLCDKVYKINAGKIITE